jgi:hypothetical protein
VYPDDKEKTAFSKGQGLWLFMAFKKVYDSVRRELLYSILMEFVVFM